MSEPEIASRGSGVPPALCWCWAWFAALTLLSAAYTLAMTFVLHKGYPYGTPVFHADSPFWDFTVFEPRFEHFRSPDFWGRFNYPFTYPAAAGVVFAAFYRSPYALQIYLGMCAAALMAGVIAMTGGLIRRGVRPGFAMLLCLTLLATSWPAGYLLNRANIEGIVAIAVAAGVIAFWKQRWWLGAMLIGFAAAMKLYPIILLGLLLPRRRYREFAGGIGAAVLLTLASLQILGPSVAVAERHISDGLLYFEHNWAATVLPTEIGFDHSFFTLVKLPVLIGYGLLHRNVPVATTPGRSPLDTAAQPAIELALRVYTIAAAVLGLWVYIARIRKLPMLNQIFALSICMVLLPPVSFDYTLVHLSVPLALLCFYVVDEWRQGREVEGVKPLFAWLAFILCMDAFLTLRYRWAGQFRAVALAILLMQILRQPLAYNVED